MSIVGSIQSIRWLQSIQHGSDKFGKASACAPLYNNSTTDQPLQSIVESMSSFNVEVQFQRLDVPLSDLQNCNKKLSKLPKTCSSKSPSNLSNLSPPWVQPLSRHVALSQWAPELALKLPKYTAAMISTRGRLGSLSTWSIVKDQRHPSGWFLQLRASEFSENPELAQHLFF